MKRILAILPALVLIFAYLFLARVSQLSYPMMSDRNPKSTNIPASSPVCVNIPPSPNYLISQKEQDAITAINNARHREHVSPLHLPDNFFKQPSLQQQFIILNAERTDRGLHALQLNVNLSQMAKAYSKQMVDLHFFAHTSPISGTFEDRFKSNPAIGDHFTIAENLAGNPVPGAGAMYEYMYNDAIEACGHRYNILMPELTLVGLGLTVGSQYGTISVQEFLGSTPTNPSREITPDTVSPHISIQKSIQQSLLHCQTIATDNVGVVRITWFLDTVGKDPHIGQSFTLDLRSVSPGKHTILAYAVDGTQNYGVARVTITV